jgi:hypothetical protein
MCCIVPKNAIVLFHQFEIMDARVYVVIVLLFLFSTCTQLQAQGNNKSDTLYGQIAHMDSLLFNAFNSRDIKTFEKLFSEDLEFYHDKGGVTGYSAIEIGSHTFCHLENGKQECGTFKFMHIWKRTGNDWKITRIISYDH